MNVCDNLGDHLVGNVYIKFRHEVQQTFELKILGCFFAEVSEYWVLFILLIYFMADIRHAYSLFLFIL